MSLRESEDRDVAVVFEGSTYQCSLVRSLSDTYRVASGFSSGSYESLGFLFHEDELIATLDGDQQYLGVTDNGTVLYSDYDSELVKGWHPDDGDILHCSLPVPPSRATIDAQRRYLGVIESGTPSELDRRPETYIRDLSSNTTIAAHAHGSGTRFGSIGFVTREEERWLVVRHTSGADHALSLDGQTTHLTSDWEVYQPDPIYVLPEQTGVFHRVIDEKSQDRYAHRVPELTYTTCCGKLVEPFESQLLAEREREVDELPYNICEDCTETPD